MDKNRMRPFLLCLLLAPAFAGTTAASDLYSSQGFEEPEFVPGVIHDQNVWSIPVAPGGLREGAIIQGDRVCVGAQALRLLNTGKGVYARLNVLVPHEFWLDFQFFMPRTEEIVNNPTFFFRGLTPSGAGGDFLVVQFAASGHIPGMKTLNGQRVRGEDWNRLTFRIDPERAVWDLYINGELAVLNEPAKGEVPLTRIHSIDFTWTGKTEFPDGGVFIDEVSLSTTKPEFMSYE